jgi:hypothetical protein
VTAEMAIALLAIVVSLCCFALLLTLLFRKDLDYATVRELRKLNEYVVAENGRLSYRLSQLYRYVEAVDEHTGARGYLVLGKGVRADDTQAREG